MSNITLTRALSNPDNPVGHTHDESWKASRSNFQDREPPREDGLHCVPHCEKFRERKSRDGLKASFEQEPERETTRADADPTRDR